VILNKRSFEPFLCLDIEEDIFFFKQDKTKDRLHQSSKLHRLPSPKQQTNIAGTKVKDGK